MRNYLVYGLLAALVLPVTAFADDHHHDHDRDHGRDWHYYNGHEWHHHHHVYADNYYMGYPRPVVVEPAPVMIAPAPVYPVYPVAPAASLNIQFPAR